MIKNRVQIILKWLKLHKRPLMEKGCFFLKKQFLRSELPGRIDRSRVGKR